MQPDEAQRIITNYGITSALTQRQAQIIRMLAQGRTAEQIAGDLHLHLGTIYTHIGQARLNIRRYEIQRANPKGRW